MEYETTEELPPDYLTPNTENATFFKPEESNDPEHFDRLRLYNRGTWKDRREENKAVTHREDNLAILNAIACQLDLPKFQKSEAQRIFDQLDLQRIGKKASVVAFGVCLIVANQYCPRGKRYWPTGNNTDTEFERIADDLGLNTSRQLSIIHVVNYRKL